MSITARVVDPGHYYENRRRPGVTRVPDGHHAVVCDACSYAVHVPCRLGRDRAEQIRRDHLLSAHLAALRTGAVLLTEVPPAFALTASGRSSSPPSSSLLGNVDDIDAVNGVAEPATRTMEGPSARFPSPRQKTGRAHALTGDPELVPAGRHFARTG